MIRIDDLDDPRLADYRNVPDPELLRERGVFIAEGRLVVRTLLAATRLHARSVLVTDTAREALSDLLAGLPEIPVYVAAPSLMNRVTGFNVHRGCLAAGDRPAPPARDALLASAPLSAPLLVLEQIGNADNIGGIFRNAAAFGAGGVLMGPGCCDPLYRKAIRVSVGATLTVPFAAIADGWPAGLSRLRHAGLTIVALTPARDATPIDDVAARVGDRRLALLLGSEGHGLTAEAQAAADVRLRIPTVACIDSLNVAAASAIALHRLSRIDR